MRQDSRLIVFLVVAVVVLLIIVHNFRDYETWDMRAQCHQIGTASWYGVTSQGKPTASGTLYDRNKLTAASRSIPLGTIVNVINLRNQRNVTVVVNDRGPYVRGRILDLSVKAARDLGMKRQGLAPVCVQLVDSAEEGR